MPRLRPVLLFAAWTMSAGCVGEIRDGDDGAGAGAAVRPARPARPSGSVTM